MGCLCRIRFEHDHKILSIAVILTLVDALFQCHVLLRKKTDVVIKRWSQVLNGTSGKEESNIETKIQECAWRDSIRTVI